MVAFFSLSLVSVPAVWEEEKKDNLNSSSSRRAMIVSVIEDRSFVTSTMSSPVDKCLKLQIVVAVVVVTNPARM